jgi:colicin import membrane protein
LDGFFPSAKKGHMDNARILQLAIEALENQRKTVEVEIAELSAQLKGGIKSEAVSIKPRSGARKATAAGPKISQSERMKAYWAAKRAQSAQPRATTAKGPQTAASRKAISERMKAYWAERRKGKAVPAASSSAKPKRGPQSAAAKKAISERMKEAWAKRKAEAAKKAK